MLYLKGRSSVRQNNNALELGNNGQWETIQIGNSATTHEIPIYGNITASGTISASGMIQTAGAISSSTRFTASAAFFSGNVTSSGNISSSGELIGLIDGGSF